MERIKKYIRKQITVCQNNLCTINKNNEQQLSCMLRFQLRQFIKCNEMMVLDLPHIPMAEMKIKYDI